MFIAGVETGGTTFVITIWTEDTREVIEELEIPTLMPEETLGAVVEFLDKYEGQMKAIGVASFGPVDLCKTSETYGFITTTPKPNWAFVDVLGPLRKYNVPIGFDTDVNAAAMGEKFYGEHGDISSIAYITVGTGIGVGLCVPSPVHGIIHPEGGHMQTALSENDTFEGCCPFHGKCIEGMCASNAISKRCGIERTELHTISDDDEVWNHVAHYLAHCCANITFLTSVEKIVLSGGVMKRSLLFGLIRKRFTEIINGYLKHDRLTDIDTYIVPSVNGNRAGAVGAYTLALQAL
ncbi:hypothetical protein PCE1_002128 [Barthelona sp. PCE]